MSDYFLDKNRYYVRHRLEHTRDPSSSSSASVCIHLTRISFHELRETLEDGTTIASGLTFQYPINGFIEGRFDLAKFEEDQTTSYESFSRMLTSLEVEEDRHPQIISEISMICSGIEKSDSSMKLWVDIDVVGEYRRDLIQEAMVESEGNITVVPATKSAIFKALKIERIESKIDGAKRKREEDVESCTICMEDLPVGAYVSKMPCSHKFHGQCIVKWLRTSHFCPVCRFEVTC